jgi:L-serine dehydratase
MFKIFNMIPSIFNDVIGPVMRGPSSSHCAAALRIGRMARDLMNGDIDEVLIEFDPGSALATTHESQGSDMGLFGGLLGWELTDERLVHAAESIGDSGTKTDIRIVPLSNKHPNAYKLTLKNNAVTHQMVAISTGGGIVDVVELDGTDVSIKGDYFEMLIITNGMKAFSTNDWKQITGVDYILLHTTQKNQIIEIKSQSFPDEDLIRRLMGKREILEIVRISPVLPVLSRKDIRVPFRGLKQMLEYSSKRDLDLWELAVRYEAERGELSGDEVVKRMLEIVNLLQKSIQQGLMGTEYKDRILGYQSGGFEKKRKEGKLLDGGILNQMVAYVTALMEVKSAMGVIVAAPTAGACAALPGSLIAAAEYTQLPDEAVAKAMLAAGLIGVFIAEAATFSAEVGGCQAECGAGSGMAAAGLVTLAGGTAGQALAAASMAIQNTLGMICDPVANRVEVPCLGKNVLAAANALSCANMALADFDPVIPLDEVIETMDRVGKSIPCELRCTALGGLSVTKTSKAVEKRLEVIGKAKNN